MKSFSLSIGVGGCCCATNWALISFFLPFLFLPYWSFLSQLKESPIILENKKQNTVPEIKSSIVYGDYEYYLTSRNYGGWLGGNSAFYLNRKNLVTGEEKVMQFFTDDFEYNYDSEEQIMVGTRFSKLLWEDEYYQFSDDIIYITNM